MKARIFSAVIPETSKGGDTIVIDRSVTDGSHSHAEPIEALFFHPSFDPPPQDDIAVILHWRWSDQSRKPRKINAIARSNTPAH